MGQNASNPLLSQFDKDVLACSAKAGGNRAGNNSAYTDDMLQSCLQDAIAKRKNGTPTTTGATVSVATTKGKRGVSLGHK